MPERKPKRNRFFGGKASHGLTASAQGRPSKATRRRRSIAMLALALCGLLTTACDRGYHPARIGSRAPQFTVNDGTRTVTLANLRGHVVLLNFWATWCVPCIDELPSLMELQRRMPQITVVGISIDEDAAAYRQFLLDNHVNFITVRDPSGKVPNLYGTIKMPETVRDRPARCPAAQVRLGAGLDQPGDRGLPGQAIEDYALAARIGL